jgi:hypothetical protein
MKSLLAIIAACSSDVSTFYVAAGSRVDTPTWNGPCEQATASDGSVAIGRDGVDARRPGRVETACRDGRLAIEARMIASIAVSGPTVARPGETFSLRVIARDAEGVDLRIGDTVKWSLDNMTEDDRCHHGFCAGPESLHVIAGNAGIARATATIGGVTGSIAFALR